MTEPLDVSLRVRMRYEAGGAARTAISDIEQLRNKATQLGTASAGDRLGRDLQALANQSRGALADVAKLHEAANRIGSSSGSARLEADLKRLTAPAQAAAKEMAAIGAATARFGSVSTVSYLQRDVVKLSGTLQTARTQAVGLEGAVERVGRTQGIQALERDLESVGRRADEAGRKIDRIGHGRGGGVGSRDRQRYDFGNELLGATGAGGGLRFGMSGAAAGGLVAGGAVVATGAAMARASREAVSFEHAMTEVRKAINETPDGVRVLERDVLRFSRTSGITKNEIAALVAQAGYLGIARGDLKEFAEISTKAAVGFQMPGADTGKSLGQLYNAYNLKDMGQLRLAGDAINRIGDTANTPERNVLDFLLRVSGPAQQYKLPMAKAGAFGGAIMGMGVPPEVAATGFDAFLGRLGTADHQSPDFQRGLRGIGLTSRRVKAMVQADPEEAMLNVLERINKLSDAKKPGVVADIAGVEHGPAIARMAEGLERIKSALDKVKDVSAYSGSLEKTFKIFSSDTQAQIKRTEAALDSFYTKVGNRLSPIVGEAAKVAERWLNGWNKSLDRGDRSDELAKRTSKGSKLTDAEQSEVDADPRLKSWLEQKQLYQQKKDAFDASRQRALGPPGAPYAPAPTMQDAQEAFRKRAEEWEARRRASDPALPGTGKRSDLQDTARTSLAAYHDEVERSLARTERLVHQASLRMREDLGLTGRTDLGAGRFGDAKIQTAALGSVDGGSNRSGGGGSGGIGRFGLSIPSGGGRSGGPIEIPPGSAERFGGVGGGTGGSSGLTGPRIGTPGAGSAGPALAGDAKERAMQYYAGLRAGGLDATHANALMGHAMQETGGTFKGDSWNKKEQAGGMLQYRGNRLENLKRFAAEQGKHWTDPYVQGQFASAEQRMDAYEAKRARSFMNAKDLGTASREAGKNVVRFGDSTGPYRESMARAFQDGSAYETLQGAAGKAAEKYSGPIGTSSQRAGDNLGEGGIGTVLQRQHGGTRNQPITERLMGQISKAAADAGVSAEVYSGGQDATGRHRTGSHRHDHGNSADLRLYETDASGRRRLLSMNNADDRAKMGLFIRKSVAHGATGVGAGPGYMGEHGIHVGGGSPLAWGKGGLSANAPDWVRAAHAHGMAEQTETMARDRAMTAKAAGGDQPSATAVSPRFSDPSSYRLKPGAEGGAGNAAGGGRFGLEGVSGPAVQNFYGGFDAHEVGRRAQLEQNRQIRRSQAGALHDIGRVG